MIRHFAALAGSLLVLSVAGIALEASNRDDPGPIEVAATDWPWWRGPNQNGSAAPDQKPPLSWSETENVLWKSPVPGRGHGSPTVVGDQVFLVTADEKLGVQSVLCFDRNTGKQIWKTDVHKGGLTKKGNGKSTQGSTSVACDGTRLFVNFLNSDAIFTTALTRDGDQIWQTRITDYTVHQGYGSSPTLHGPLVIVSGDNKGKSGGVVAGLNRKTGSVVWKHSRPSTANYSSPIVLPVAGREQLIMTGCNLVSGFDPLNGEKLWEIAGATIECVTSTVTNGKLIYTSGGYPRNHVAAVNADGSGEVVWENKTRVYVPSMLMQDGYLYAVADAGFAVCWDSNTGEEKWKGRLGGTFTSSPLLVNGHILATNEAGKTYVFKATPEEFESVGENQLGNQAYATPIACGGRIYTRVVHTNDDKRQEMLYCIGEK